jgi:hypothetical protein
MTLGFVVGVAITVRIDINSSLILACGVCVRVCGELEIVRSPFLGPDCNSASPVHWDLCLRSSETCEITAKYSLRPLAIGHIVSALRYGLLDVRMFGKEAKYSYISLQRESCVCCTLFQKLFEEFEQVRFF